MAHVIHIPTFTDTSGSLSIIEELLPFEIKRFYYIYNVSLLRGGHRHHKNKQALISVGGNCKIYVNNGIEENVFLLDKPDKCLILETKDWHTMDKFSDGCTLLVFASELYDVNDYIDEKY